MYINVDAGVTVSGAGVTASAITSPEVLFPLRLGYACGVGVPLPTVTITGVDNVVAGIRESSFSVAPTDTVNTRTGPCPASSPARRVQRDLLLLEYSRSLRATTARAAYVATAGTAAVNGSYILVRLRIAVAVPEGAVAAAGGNASAIAAVAAVVADVSRLLPASANSSGAFDLAYGTFLVAVASSVGVNVSALSVGSTGAPTVAAAAGSTSSSPSTGSASSGLAAGAVAGIVIALLLAICLAVACCCFIVRRRKAAPKEASAVPSAGAVPTQTNPLHASNEITEPSLRVVPPAGTSAANPSDGDAAKPTDSIPVVRNPLLVQRDLRSASSVATALELLPAGASTATGSAAGTAAVPVLPQPPRKPQSSRPPEAPATDSGKGAAPASAAAAPAPLTSSRRPLDSSLDAYTNPLSRALVESVALQRRAGVDVRGAAPAPAPARHNAADSSGAEPVAAAPAGPPTPQLPRLRREALLLPTPPPRSAAVNQLAAPTSADVSAGAAGAAHGDDSMTAHAPQLPRSRTARVSRAGARAARGASAGANAPVPQADAGTEAGPPSSSATPAAVSAGGPGDVAPPSAAVGSLAGPAPPSDVTGSPVGLVSSAASVSGPVVLSSVAASTASAAQ